MALLPLLVRQVLWRNNHLRCKWLSPALWILLEYHKRNSSIESCKDKFFSPGDVATKVKALQLKHGVDQFRISGREPILGEASAKHLGEVIRLCKSKVVVETNVILLGRDPSLLDSIPKRMLASLIEALTCPTHPWHRIWTLNDP
jgi:uncharacterized Fe-S cluster-containing radical SAM superfamily protein